MGSTKPTHRRYSQEQKDQAVRLVGQLQTETGQKHGAVQRVAAQLGYGVESVRSWLKQAESRWWWSPGGHHRRSRADPQAGAGEPGAAPGE